MLTIAQTAALLGVSQDTLRNWDEQGKLQAERTAGGHRRYRPKALVDYLVAADSPEAPVVWRKLAALGFDVPVSPTVLVSGLGDLREQMQAWYAQPLLSLGIASFDKALAGGCRRGWMGYVQGKSMTLKTTWAIQRAVELAADGERVILFNLEMRAQAVLERVIRAHLGVGADDVAEIILANDERMQAVRALYDNLHVVDWYGQPSPLSPEQLEQIVREVNLSKFAEAETSVVIVDHLGLMRPSAEAPRIIRNDPSQWESYMAEQLFQTTKALDVLMLIVQQLPKDVPPGIPFSYDRGRGGAKLTDFSDFIIGLWLPGQADGLAASERQRLQGVLHAALLKNRYGPQVEQERLRVEYETMTLAHVENAGERGLE